MAQEVPKNGGAVHFFPAHPEPEVDLRALQAENLELRGRMRELMAQAERNHDIMCRHQAFDLEIVGASAFPELIGIIFRTLPVISELDVVTLCLLDQDSDIHTVMRNLGVNFDGFPNLVFVDGEEPFGLMRQPPAGHAGQGGGQRAPGPYRPLLGPFDPESHGLMFPSGLCQPRSVAVVPLMRNRRLIGSLNLGSLDAARFAVSMGTDFIEHMASIIAICLENVISNELLKYIGLTDSLTGVYNRRYIDRRLLEEIARARRHDYRISCLFIDIDHFKQVNDSVGHQGGDDVLRDAAARIKAELRLSDALARFGGEEFLVLLIDADLPSAIAVAERIRASVADQPFHVCGGVQLQVTASVGVATLTESDLGGSIETIAQQFVAKADHALYEAKEAGRNRVMSY